MPAGPRRTPATPASPRPPAAPASSPLVRQLSRLAGAQAPAARRALAAQLAPWLGLTDAIALAGALSAAPPAATAAQPAAGLVAEAARLRQRLAASLAEPPAAPARRGAAPARPADLADFTPHRRRYHACQQALDAGIAPLRARLREALATRGGALARLAAVDAVIADALAERERTLLSVVPVLLEKRFEQLRQSQANDGPAVAWLTTFRHDMQQLLLAELDHRWQPVQGLLAALQDTP